MGTIILSGNKDFSITTQKDLEFNTFVKKFNILNISGLTYEFLRDNRGDYWLIQVVIDSTIKNPVVLIPSFIEGIIQREQAVNFIGRGHTKIMEIYGGKRFYSKEWDIHEKSDGLPGLISYDNIYGDIQIIGSNKALKGIGYQLFKYVNQNSISFRSLNISQFYSLDEMFQDSLIQHVDLSGINFGKPKYMHRFFAESAIKEVDLSTVDFSECRRISQMFFGCEALERVKWGGKCMPDNLIAYDLFLGCNQIKIYNFSDIKCGNNTGLKGIFVECENLEELDLQSITSQTVQQGDQIEDIIRYLPNLKILKINRGLVSGLADNEKQLNKLIRDITEQADLKIIYIG